MPFSLSDETADAARERIRSTVGDVEHFNVFGNKILVGVYVAPEKTKGGIIRVDQTLKEDVYQGKVGVVLRKGPSAFQDDDRYSFHGMDVAEGDWIVFRASDGFPMVVNNDAGHVRLLEDTDVKMTTPRPDLVW